MQRKIKELSKLNGRVYVYLADEKTGKRFFRMQNRKGSGSVKSCRQKMNGRTLSLLKRTIS